MTVSCRVCGFELIEGACANCGNGTTAIAPRRGKRKRHEHRWIAVRRFTRTDGAEMELQRCGVCKRINEVERT